MKINGKIAVCHVSTFDWMKWILMPRTISKSTNRRVTRGPCEFLMENWRRYLIASFLKFRYQFWEIWKLRSQIAKRWKTQVLILQLTINKRYTYLTFRSPHHTRGLSEDWRTNSNILLSHFLLLTNEFTSSFQPLFGAYVFNKRKVSNSAKMTRPSGSCFEASNRDKYLIKLPSQWKWRKNNKI